MPARELPRASLVTLCVLAAAVAGPSVERPMVAQTTTGAARATVVGPRAAGGADPAASIGALFAEAVKPDHPAVTAIVVKDGKTLFRKAYGLANLELQVPARPEMVFRIGSVTKQFTAAAIMILVEEGKLALADDITKVLPDYPAQGSRITIEHLLTHTSGIQSYTDMPSWRPLLMKDMTTAEMLAVFSKEPMQFQPGEKWRYNNSGYYLLGAIIEKVSGQKYAEFLKRRIFDKAGMAHTFYGGTSEIIPGRVGLYAQASNGVVNADYISMTQPFSAGALVSSVDDLAEWNAALDAGAIVSKASLAKIFTPYVLKNGQSAGYGYGWNIGSYESHVVQEHGGGIHGGRAHVVRLPNDGVYVAVLSNFSAPTPDPTTLARKAAVIAIGKRVVDPTPVVLPPAVLDSYVGVFTLPDGSTRVVTREGSRVLWLGTRGSTELLPLKEGEFFMKGNAFARFRFDIDRATGKATRVTVDDWGVQQIATRTEGR